jgi:hypothetical protein
MNEKQKNIITPKSSAGQVRASEINFKVAYDILFKAYIRTYRKEAKEELEKGGLTNG